MSRYWLLAALAAASLAGAAPAAQNKAVFPEQLASSSRVRAKLDVALSETKFATELMDDRSGLVSGEILKAFMEGQRTWARADIPSVLSNILPDASLYLVADTGRHVRQLFVKGEDRLYEVPREFNQLLYDCGLRFSDADARRWPKLLLFFCLAARECGAGVSLHASYDFWNVKWKSWDSVFAAQKPLVPAFSIDSLSLTIQGDYPDSMPPLYAERGQIKEVRFVVRTGSGKQAVIVYTQNGPILDGRLRKYFDGMVFPMMFDAEDNTFGGWLDMPRLSAWDD